jgi:serine phosphatase RsbU (regulator of sigma subunit)
VLRGIEFSERQLTLAGGSLYVCSDGLTEACEAGAALGSAGLERLVLRFAAKPLLERVQAIAAEVSRLEPRDDLTLLAVGDPESHAR